MKSIWILSPLLISLVVASISMAPEGSMVSQSCVALPEVAQVAEQNSTTIDDWLDQLADPERSVQQEAVEQLANAGEAALPGLEGILTDISATNRWVRPLAVRTLGRMETPGWLRCLTSKCSVTSIWR